MVLERLVLAGGMLLTTLGCTSTKFVKKPYIPIEPVKAPELQGYDPPREGYDEVRYQWGKLYMHQATLLTPSLTSVESDKEKDAKTLEERRKQFADKAVGRRGQFSLENKNHRIIKSVFGENRIYGLNEPADKTSLIGVINGCLEAKPVDRGVFGSRYCYLVCEDKRGLFEDVEGWGLIIGERYVLTLASLVYNHIATEENKVVLGSETDVKLGVYNQQEMLEENKEIYESHKARVLVVNPRLDLAILEITDENFKVPYTLIPIVESKLLEEVYSYAIKDTKLNRFGLKELTNEFSTEELDMALALRYGVITIGGTFWTRGTPLYGRQGLIGLIAGNLEKRSVFEESKKFKNFHVVGGSLIRNFLMEYADSLKEGNLEKLVLFERFEPEVKTKETPTEPFKIKEHTIMRERISEEGEFPEEPWNFDPFAWFIGLTALFGVAYSEKKITKQILEEGIELGKEVWMKNAPKLEDLIIGCGWKVFDFFKFFVDSYKLGKVPLKPVEPMNETERLEKLERVEAWLDCFKTTPEKPEDISLGDVIIYRSRTENKTIVKLVGGIRESDSGEVLFEVYGDYNISFYEIESILIKGKKIEAATMSHHETDESKETTEIDSGLMKEEMDRIKYHPENLVYSESLFAAWLRDLSFWNTNPPQYLVEMIEKAKTPDEKTKRIKELNDFQAERIKRFDEAGSQLKANLVKLLPVKIREI